MANGSREDGPGTRLLRLWLWTAPMGMLALSVFFGALAVGEERWGLLAAMVLLAVTAVGLWLAQWFLLKRITNVNKRP